MFTTSAMTGLRMKRSVKLLDSMAGVLGWLPPNQVFVGFGASLAPGVEVLLTCTGTPLRSLNTPEVTICSPAFSDDNKVAASGTQFHELLADTEELGAILTLDLFHDVHRVAVRGVRNCR